MQTRYNLFEEEYKSAQVRKHKAAHEIKIKIKSEGECKCAQVHKHKAAVILWNGFHSIYMEF